jgi:hypothetical protein
MEGIGFAIAVGVTLVGGCFFPPIWILTGILFFSLFVGW